MYGRKPSQEQLVFSVVKKPRDDNPPIVNCKK